MSLKYMTGFDTVGAAADIQSQGWANTTRDNNVSTSIAGFPSQSGMAGRFLGVMGPFAAAKVPGTGDPAWYNTGITIKSLWDNGGFVVGAYARFNQTYTKAPATGTTATLTYPTNQLSYDGTRYWTIMTDGSTGSVRYYVAYSTDLTNWTEVPPPGTLTINNSCSIKSLNDGRTVILPNTGTNDCSLYYTSNLGVTWTRTPIVSLYTTHVSDMVETGDATYPFAVACTSNANPAGVGIFLMNNLSASTTFTQAPTANMASLTTGFGYLKLRCYNGFLLGCYGYNALHVGNFATGITTASSWYSGQYGTGTAPFGSPSDIIFANNKWYLTSNYSAGQGIYVQPNSATLPAVSAPSFSAAWTQITPGSMTGVGTYPWGYFVNSMDTDGNGNIVAAGQAAYTYWSNDGGVTWSATRGGNVLSSLSNNWNRVIWAGGKFVFYSEAACPMMVSTLNGRDNWTGHYFSDVTEATPSSVSSFGVYSVTAANASTGAVTQTTGAPGALIFPSQSFSGTRTITLQGSSTANTSVVGTSNVNQVTNGLWHYYEIIATKDASTANKFSLSLKIDGAVTIPAGASVALAPSGDTTSTALINIPINGSWVGFDDIYMTDFGGTTNAGAIGPVKIVLRQPLSDSQAQWTKTGSAANNALSTKKTTGTGVDGNYVTTDTVGKKDIYNLDAINPASLSGYKVRAVQVEAYAARATGQVPSMKVGVVSGAASADGAEKQISSSTPSYMSATFEADPNTGTDWTLQAAIDSKISLTKTV